MSLTAYEYLKFIRKEKFPTMWCPGCGNGIAMKALIEAIDKAIKDSNIDKDKTVIVSGIGCSSRITAYLDFNTIHTVHGRALAFATGIKLANPELNIIVIMGDGDATAIGGNHFIHTCRRNIDLTAIVVNNSTYGMTGGQYSPTTPVDSIASTALYGTIETPVDICKLAEACEANFVARSTTYHFKQAVSLIGEAMSKKGLSLVEILTQCPTHYMKKNGFESPADMLLWYRDNVIPVSEFEKIPDGEVGQKIPMGVIVNRNNPGYLKKYQELIQKLAGDKE